MQRYFVNKEQFFQDNVVIVGDDLHHLTKVLRSKVGDRIIISNGQGRDVVGEIISIEQDRVNCKIVSTIEEKRDPAIEIILAQGVPKSDKMDLIIQKGTEIGVTSFIPFASERTIVQLNDKKEQKRIERWKKIAKEAAEQAHRSIIPEIYPVLTFQQLLQRTDKQLTLIAYEQEHTVTLFQALSNNNDTKKILLIIGPEGGFAEMEINKATMHGAISVSLGKRILRTETAGLVGAANILYHLEGI